MFILLYWGFKKQRYFSSFWFMLSVLSWNLQLVKTIFISSSDGDFNPISRGISKLIPDKIEWEG